ncbi:splicing factor, Prp19-binding domain-containing protein [Dichomitus squalens]|uniref:Splicing factor, Prp19-binding domain-containing protein n=1 Tax=Dichomitus squalens TaxID=114155 RepID=A0A4Q9PE45_9APHY|nr:splicing factor, Prp19-binding domain-containing protein [Dichomitus squalens]TBU53160.1 splicing factor, Prp19-binding domain-containing protein [Dichomitus squalens]
MSTRKPAPRLPRPAARYWKGKAPKGADAAQSESDEDEVAEEQQAEDEGDVLIRDVEVGDGEGEEEDGLEVRRAVERQAKGTISVALRDVNVSKEGKVIVGGKEESGRTAAELEEGACSVSATLYGPAVPILCPPEEEEEEEEEEAADEEEEEEEESSEEESASEEEQPNLQFRPVFVPKRARATVAEREAIAEDSEEAQKRKETEAEERKKASHDMVAETIRRELLEKEKEQETPDVDDTDGIDPAGEFEAWRLRELARIKRDKEAELAREREREEIERRRALPEEQRLKEDMERAEQSRKEKPKGQQKFLQKYWHKGAFHQDEEILRKHDYTEATESTVDVSLLPKVMQVKNFGKRGRTKYTHLLDQDTTVGSGGFGGTAPVKAGGTSTSAGGCFLCGGPHLKKDCPQNADLPPGRTATGANGAPTGASSRQWGARHGDRDGPRGSWRDRDEDRRPSGDSRDRRRDEKGARDRDRYQRDDDGERARYDRHRGDRRDDGDRVWRRHSRSRSPTREGRRRSRERSVDLGRGEKRRRVD